MAKNERLTVDTQPEADAEKTQEEQETFFFDVGALFGQKRVNHGDPNNAFKWNWPIEHVGDGELHNLKEERLNENSEIILHLPDSTVTLMAQYVWQSSITLSENLCSKSIDVRGKTVLELGAGSALPGIVAALSGAEFTVTTDYPEEEIVKNMERNVQENLKSDFIKDHIKVCGFKWGEDSSELIELNGGNKFDVIIMADTLWLDDQHENLAKSCAELLKEDGLLVSAYMHHDDRSQVAPAFFEIAREQHHLETISERAIEWDDTRVESDDPEEYGLVYLRLLRLQKR